MIRHDRQPLPMTMAECRERGWQQVDIVLVSGDAYVDHPSFGLALIGRLLESHGYRVAVLAQPHFSDEHDFRRFGRPRLFFGISSGNLDSIVANYSGNGKVRTIDAYSPNGSPWRSTTRTRENRYRPDRAVLAYANLAKHAFPGIPVILGGIEASLRRFIHFDYQQDRLRGSHLTDAKADLLIYGMAEQAIIEAARRIETGQPLADIPGTCIRVVDKQIETVRRKATDDSIAVETLPSWHDIARDRKQFLAAEVRIDRLARSGSNTILLQRQQAGWIVHYPPAAPLSTAALDHLFSLPFSRKPHPLTPTVPAYEMVKDSITIVRGCCGNCSFCAIGRHQGPTVVSRSIDSIVSEAAALAADDEFGGTISDLGGPTANLYGTSCAIGSCSRHDCLYPQVCKHLLIDESKFLSVLAGVGRVDRIAHVFVSSGLRLALLLKTPKLLEALIRFHTPGALKIAPEHTEDNVLRLMHKESFKHLELFVRQFRAVNQRWGLRRELIPYIISAHPGCDETLTVTMVTRLQELGLIVRQFQDFTPTPGTLSTAMDVAGLDRDTGEPISVARGHTQRARQRKIIERAFFRRPKTMRSSLQQPARKHAPRPRAETANRSTKKNNTPLQPIRSGRRGRN